VTERTHSGELGVDGWIILKWIFRKRVLETYARLLSLRTETVGGMFVNALMNLRVP
jgi:hypothetical protein